MKKAILSLACVATVFSMSAQRASDSAFALNDNKDYNRIGISYNNTHYGYNDAYGKDHSENNFGLNGIGIDYIHGFSVSQNIPLYVEAGLNLDFNFGTKDWGKDYDSDGDWTQYKDKWSNINMQIPVNVAWKFAAGEDFAIMPYLGINFKIHFDTKYKEQVEASEAYDQKSVEEWNDRHDWISVFDDGDDAMGSKDYTWNRFQMGWQIGVGFQYKPLYLGVQYGTDFIPAYSHKFTYNGDSETAKISTGNLKVTLAYCF